jgi:hypothetical protein
LGADVEFVVKVLFFVNVAAATVGVDVPTVVCTDAAGVAVRLAAAMEITVGAVVGACIPVVDGDWLRRAARDGETEGLNVSAAFRNANCKILFRSPSKLGKAGFNCGLTL